jgi:hypothetical protein
MVALTRDGSDPGLLTGAIERIRTVPPGRELVRMGRASGSRFGNESPLM